MEQDNSQIVSTPQSIDVITQRTEPSDSPSGNAKNLLILALSILLIAATSFAYYFYKRSSQVTEVVSQNQVSVEPPTQDATTPLATSQPTQSTKTESFRLSYYDYETKITTPALKIMATIPAEAVVRTDLADKQKYIIDANDFSMSFILPSDGAPMTALKDPTVATISNSYAVKPIIRIHAEGTPEPIFYYGHITESGPVTQICNFIFENAKPEDICYEYFTEVQLKDIAVNISCAEKSVGGADQCDQLVQTMQFEKL
jgi:hypothetical protein